MYVAISTRSRHARCGRESTVFSAPDPALSTAHAPHAFDEIIQRLRRLPRIDRQSDQPVRYRFGDGELPLAKTTLLKRCGVMQRRIVCSHSDAALVKHRVNEIVPGSAKLLSVNLNWI